MTRGQFIERFAAELRTSSLFRFWSDDDVKAHAEEHESDYTQQQQRDDGPEACAQDLVRGWKRQ